MLGGLASLISSVAAPETVYLVLVSIAGFAVVGVWMSIAASQFFHRRTFVRGGGDPQTLAYRTPFYPYVPILAFTLCAVSLIGIALDSSQVAALYFGIPFVVLCYVYHPSGTAAVQASRGWWLSGGVDLLEISARGLRPDPRHRRDGDRECGEHDREHGGGAVVVEHRDEDERQNGARQP